MSVTIGAPVAPERSSAPLDLLRRELTGEVHMLNGSSSDVGVVGYTTGGGVGPMARTYGLTGVPPQLAARMTLGVRFLWTGEPGHGERLLDEIRSVAPVILDDAALKPYTAIDSVHADPVRPHASRRPGHAAH